MGYSKKLVTIMLVFLLLFVIACFIVVWHTSVEPDTLILSVFAFCGIEGGLMAWIKTTKLKNSPLAPAQVYPEEKEPTIDPDVIDESTIVENDEEV